MSAKSFMHMDSIARATDEIFGDDPILTSREDKEKVENPPLHVKYVDDLVYANYVYDELDEDATFRSLFDMLVEMFPIMPRNEVKMIMRLANNFDELTDTLVREAEVYTFIATDAAEKEKFKINIKMQPISGAREEFEREQISLRAEIEKEQAELRQQIKNEQKAKREQIEREQAELRIQLQKEQEASKDVKQYHRDVYDLKHMFPDHDFEVLNQQLQLSNHDVEVAVHKLLEGVPEKYVEHPAEVSNAIIMKNGQRIKELINIQMGEIINCLRANSGKIGQTLVALIMKGVQSRIESPHGVTGGKVQRGNARMVSGARVNMSTNAKKPSNLTATKKVLKYSNSPEAKELVLLYNSNSSFHGISESFLYVILNAVNGDVFKSIEICLLIVEDQCEHLTVGTEKAEEHKDMSYVDAVKNKKPKQQTYGDDAMDMMSIKFQSFKTRRNQISESHKTEYNAEKGPFLQTLDLHNLRLTTAMAMTKQALSVWWNHEMELRTIDGRMEKFGNRAACVASFVVITGRGLHSAGGVAVIRRGVKNFLDSNGYLYTEHTGRFEVTGRL